MTIESLPPAPLTDGQQAEMATRAVHDAELIRGGARYNKLGELAVTKDQYDRTAYERERALSDSMVRTAEETLGDLRKDGLTRIYKPNASWEGPYLEETAAVDLSGEAVEKLGLLGYPDAKQAYMVKTGSSGEGSWRGFGGAYVHGDQTDYELRILTGGELGKYDKHPNPDAFLGRELATLSPECPVRLNMRLNTDAQAQDSGSEMVPGSASQQVLEQVLSEIHSAQPTEIEPKFVASNL